jgi:3-oxoacyl-[acyl-carrier protein] reductase
MKLDEMKVIVTGAASGLGRCFTEELVRAGASVLASDLNAEGLAELREKNGPRVETFVGDVSKEADVVAMVARGWEVFGEINGLINNAGIFRDAFLVRKDRKTNEIKAMTLDQWQKVIDVDLTGPFLCTREVAARLVDAGKPGVLVSISSVSRHGNRGQTNYSAAKAGLIADTKLWAEELAPYGIRTGAVAPGFTQTPILDAMKPEVLEKIVANVPLKRTGTPFEIWQAVRFIMECDYFTGRCVDVDGGLTV